MPLLYGWLVVAEKTSVSNDGKKQTTYTWDARCPKEYFSDLIMFCQNLRAALDARYKQVIPEPVKKLHKIFDLEKAIKHLCKFKSENGKLLVSREDRVEWETDGTNEFAEFYKVVCDIPHIRDLSDTDHNLALLSHHSNMIIKRFKGTLEKMVWFDLENCAAMMFVDERRSMVNEFNESNLVSLTELTEISIHHWFEMKFSSGVILKARVHEENVVSLFYNNRCIYSSLGKEMCIAVDIALAASGCEAIVEGFYSVTAAHKMNGGQGNNVLVQRAIVDWCIPNPISCPNTMAEIAYLYTEGDKKRGMARHRLTLYGDERERAAQRHDVSEVIDRLGKEIPRCPHVVSADRCDNSNN